LTFTAIPLSEFQAGSLLYRQTLADLAFARMRFPRHSVVQDLEQLIGRAHSVIYQARRVKREDWKVFWKTTWPRLVIECLRPILIATILFWGACGIGFFLTVQYPLLERFFISESMREGMEKGELWTESITKAAPLATSRIMTNNIGVCIAAWALGITFGIGTIYLLVINGIMLGAVFAGCMRLGMFQNLAEFVIAHGSLELPAIWISGGAGLILGQAMVFPGRYSRSVEIGIAGRKSMQLLIGVIPMLIIAGLVEGFVSPSNLSSTLKVSLAALLAASYLVYIYIGSRKQTSLQQMDA